MVGKSSRYTDNIYIKKKNLSRIFFFLPWPISVECLVCPTLERSCDRSPGNRSGNIRSTDATQWPRLWWAPWPTATRCRLNSETRSRREHRRQRKTRAKRAAGAFGNETQKSATICAPPPWPPSPAIWTTIRGRWHRYNPNRPGRSTTCLVSSTANRRRNPSNWDAAGVRPPPIAACGAVAVRQQSVAWEACRPRNRHRNRVCTLLLRV